MKRVFRPRRSLQTAVVLSVVLLVVWVLGWWLLPASIRELFTWPQLLTLALFVAVMIGVMLAIGLSRITTDAQGMTFRNGIRTRRVEWAQIHGFRFGEDDPWPYLIFADEGQRPLLGIQRTDRSRAQADFQELVDLWRSGRQP